MGVDILTLNGRDYLLTVDYFSRFCEIDLLEGMKSQTVIRKLNVQFARFGIPDVVMTDDGPQFSSKEFGNFEKLWSLSMSHHPQDTRKALAKTRGQSRMLNS